MASASTTAALGIVIPGSKSPNNLTSAYESSSPQYRLPTELVHEIFSYLPPSDYGSARLVCWLWYQASLSKSLLRSLLFRMEFNPFNSSCPCFIKPTYYGSYQDPSTAVCPETCLCNYKFPDEPISTWDLKSLRTALALALDKWPSTVRVSCGKLIVDMSALFGNYNADWGYSDSLRETESICFSEYSGSFVGTVTMATGKHGEVERKLWIHRLFTSKYSPSNSFARPDVSLLYFIEASRYLPGQLYMTIKLTNFPGMPVVGLQIKEHAAFSAVREIVVSYANNKEEKITFDKFKLDKKIPVGGSSDGTVFYDRNGVTYRSSYRPQQNPDRQQQTIKGSKNWANGFLSGERLARRKETVFYTGLPKRTNLATVRTSQRLLASIGEEGSHHMCYRVTVPLPPLSQQGGYCSIIVAPESSIFVCAPSINSPGPAENVHARYKLSVPVRVSETARPRITHITMAPQYFRDFARGVWWMAICAAYDNGEIWLWQIDTEDFLREGSLSDTIAFPVNLPTHDNDGPPLSQVPKNPLDIRAQASESRHQPHINDGIRDPWPSDFNEEFGKCVSANLYSFSGHALGDTPTKKVKVLLPTPAGENDGFKYTRACKLGYMPGLEALNFVGRGRTVLAGTKKEVVVWDMRLWRGLERGKLKAEF